MSTSKSQNRLWLTGLRGLLAVIFGGLLILSPGQSLVVLLQVFSVYLLLDGAVRLFGVYRKHYGRARLFHLILGVAGIVTGAIVVGAPLLNIAIAAGLQSILGILIGTQAVFAGLLAMLSAWALRGGRRVVNFLGGIGATVMGVVTVVSVLSNDTSLVPIIGVFAAGFGAIYLFLAYTAYQARRVPTTS